MTPTAPYTRHPLSQSLPRSAYPLSGAMALTSIVNKGHEATRRGPFTRQPNQPHLIQPGAKPRCTVIEPSPTRSKARLGRPTRSPQLSNIFCHSIKASNTASQALARRSRTYHRQHPPPTPQETAKPASPNIVHSCYDAHLIQIQEPQPHTGALGSLVQSSEQGLFEESSNCNVFQTKARQLECPSKHIVHCLCGGTHRSIDKMK